LLRPRPLRTARAPFRCMQLKHWSTRLGSTRLPHWTWGQPGRYYGRVGYRFDGGGSRTSRSIALRPHLRRFLRRLTDDSRPPTPEGSLLAFTRGDLAFRLNPYPSHYSLAFAFSLVLYPQPHRLTLRSPYPEGKATGLPRSANITEWVRSCL